MNDPVYRYYLEYRAGTSDKFYRIVVVENGRQYMTVANWGRRGTSGQSQMKSFGSGAQALTEAAKLARQKLRKGYRMANDPFKE